MPTLAEPPRSCVSAPVATASTIDAVETSQTKPQNASRNVPLINYSGCKRFNRLLRQALESSVDSSEISSGSQWFHHVDWGGSPGEVEDMSFGFVDDSSDDSDSSSTGSSASTTSTDAVGTSAADWAVTLGTAENSCPTICPPFKPRCSAIYVRSGLLQKATFHVYAKDVRPEPSFVLEIANVEDINQECARVEGRLRKRSEKQLNSDSLSSHEESASSTNHPQWVIKASQSNCGKNIGFCRSIEEVKVFLEREIRTGSNTNTDSNQEERSRDYVLQRYIRTPLISGERRFHMRTLVLVAGNVDTGFIEVFLHEKSAVCLTAREKVAGCGEGNMDRVLTNFCASGDSARLLKDVIPELVGYLNGQRQKWECTGSAAAPTFNESEAIKHSENFHAALLQKMKTQLKTLFARFLKKPLLFCPLPNQFEVFGVDFLLEDPHGTLAETRVSVAKPETEVTVPPLYILEVNGGPNFNMYADAVLEGIVGDLVQFQKESVVNFLRASESSPAARPFSIPDCDPQSFEDGCAIHNWFPIMRTEKRPFGAENMADCLKTFQRKMKLAGKFIVNMHASAGIGVKRRTDRT